jgi:hypothetical protein
LNNKMHFVWLNCHHHLIECNIFSHHFIAEKLLIWR